MISELLNPNHLYPDGFIGDKALDPSHKSLILVEDVHSYKLWMWEYVDYRLRVQSTYF